MYPDINIPILYSPIPYLIHFLFHSYLFFSFLTPLFHPTPVYLDTNIPIAYSPIHSLIYSSSILPPPHHFSLTCSSPIYPNTNIPILYSPIPFLIHPLFHSTSSSSSSSYFHLTSMYLDTDIAIPPLHYSIPYPPLFNSYLFSSPTFFTFLPNSYVLKYQYPYPHPDPYPLLLVLLSLYHSPPHLSYTSLLLEIMRTRIFVRG